MKLTDKHVNDRRLGKLIGLFEDRKRNIEFTRPDIVKALLELKQRRAEDRFNEQAKVEK